MRERYVMICTALNYTLSPVSGQEGLGELTIPEFVFLFKQLETRFQGMNALDQFTEFH